MYPEIDARLEALQQARQRWVTTSADGRADLLFACIDATTNVAAEWVERVCRAKGITPGTAFVGEAWLSGPMTTIRTLRLAAEALRNQARPALPAVREREDRVVVSVTPASRLEYAALGGLRADVWLEPGSEPTQGSLYHDPEDPRRGGGVALVLGAGNISAIASKDIVHKLVADNEVVILKMHPVLEYLSDLFEQAFAPLIDAGFLTVCRGGAELGSYLSRHELVGSIHLTGSDQTYDAIVWGATEEERTRRRAAGDRVVTKPFSAELGCVTPVLVVPGNWSAREIGHQAASIAGMVAHNASFNCSAAKAVVTAAGWPQREEFLDRLRAELRSAPPRRAYYPGARQRYASFLEHYPGAEILGAEAEGAVPWTLIADVAPRRSEYALGNEAFCGILTEVAVPASDAAAFLERAVPFANDEIWGSLSCNVAIDPRTARSLGRGLEDAIAGLEYGGVAVNTWSSALFGLASPTWGAYPGNTPANIGSGAGVVGNAFFLDHPERSVAYGSFVQWPKPPWFAHHRSLARLGRKWTAFEASPSWAKLPAFALAAVRA
jgi:acyl-CoA reductase-like NAD-dependent aldehyde dehydrogenase